MLKTQGEIESAISEGMNDFEREYMGRGPKITVEAVYDQSVGPEAGKKIA